ncbi:hypothetical protein MY4824_002702 [Beauveria thailandica]
MSLFPARKFLEGVCDIDNQDYNSSFTAGFHGYGGNLDRYNPGGPYSYSSHPTDISPELPPTLPSNHTNSGSSFSGYNNQLQNQHPNFQAASSTAHSAVPSKYASSPDSQKKVPEKRRSDRSLSHKRGSSGMNSQWSGGNADASHGGAYQPQQVPRELSGGSSYSPRQSEDVLPMGPTEQLGTLQYLDSNSNPTGPTVEINIASLVHKNFFFLKSFWTCYRRNYMACNCSYTITPYFPGVHLAFKHSQESAAVPILGFAMFISAVVADHPHQVIPLIQHTPKRDKGPIGKPTKQLMGPRNRPNQGTPPHMGIADGIQQTGQIYSDIYGVSASQGTLPTEHNFDRLQFKTATANNGERRAGQQRYQLRLELWGDTGGIDESSRWKRIAVSYSPDVVVRGRSPGHYMKDRRGSSGSGGGSSQGNMYSNSGNGGGDYGTANVVGGQPNYMATGPYDNRGGNQYFNGAAGHHARQDMAAYPIDPKPYDSTRMFPSAFTNPQPVYGDPGLYHHGLHQHQQHHQQPTGVSPQEIYGKPRDLDMGVLPRPEPQLRMGHDARCNVSATAGGAPSILPPLMSSMVNPGSYLSNS